MIIEVVGAVLIVLGVFLGIVGTLTVLGLKDKPKECKCKNK